MNKASYGALCVVVIIAFAIVAIKALVLELVWNEFVCVHVTGAHPTSYWASFLVVLALSLLSAHATFKKGN